MLGWAYIDTGRWDEALEVAAEAAGLAEANHMDIVAASADVITATVLALRADSAQASSHTARALAAVDPAECGLVAARARRALGVAALADGSYLQAFTQFRGLFSDDGTPLHNYASYLGVADLAAAAVRADRRMEGRDVIEHALSHLSGMASPRLEQLIARARGILADPAKAGVQFGTALSDPAGDQWPFERAQLRLDHGEWLRRRRRINDAKPVLTEALTTFRRLRARSGHSGRKQELRACGVAVAGPRRPRRPVGANPPAAPDRPPGQRRPDQPPDWRPALPVTAHGQLAPVPVLPQARGSQPKPATRRDRPRQHAHRAIGIRQVQSCCGYPPRSRCAGWQKDPTAKGPPR